MSQTSTNIGSSMLAGGAVTFHVVASDGLLTARADSNPITLANRPPQPQVLAPANGSHVTLGQAATNSLGLTAPSSVAIIVDANC